MWVLVLSLVGLFAAFLYYLQTRPQPLPTDEVKTEEAKVDAKQAKEPEAVAPKFDFYSVLPDLEVVVPEEGQAAVGPGKKPAEVEKPGKYYLQSGSFRDVKDADRRRAALAILGVESKIEKVNINQDEIWHRVRIGPIEDLQELNQVRNLLHANKIETMLLRVKG